MVIAHAGGWIASLIYLTPLIVIGVGLAIDRLRKRTDDSPSHDDENQGES